MSKNNYQNYYQFVKELALKSNRSFKEQLLNPESKIKWNSIKPKKVRVKKGVKKEVKIDISRAELIPSEIKPKEDTLLNYYNQRWLNFVNSLYIERKDLNIYNLEPIKYLLNNKIGIIEDSPYSFELSSFILNPKVYFQNKRNLRIYRNDVKNVSRYLNDINITNQTYTFEYDFESNSKPPFSLSLYEQVDNFYRLLNRNITKKPNIVYLNDLMYDKRMLYSLIFFYGSYLTRFIKDRDKNLIVVTKHNLGDNAGNFYKRLDSAFYNGSNFEWGIPDISANFNFVKIAKYLSGEYSDTLIPSQIVKQPSSDYKPDPAIQLNTTFPNQQSELSERIYYILSETISMNNLTEDMSPKEGEFIQLNGGYLSQIVSKSSYRVFDAAIFDEKEYKKTGRSTIRKFTLREARSIPSFKLVRFIEKGKPHPKNVKYTSLRNMAINPILTYEQVYNQYKEFFTNENDDSNIRGNEGGLIDFNKRPNEFNEQSLTTVETQGETPTEIPTETQVETQGEIPGETQGEPDVLYLGEEDLVQGGSLSEEDLVLFISTFNLKGVDLISDNIGNNQKAYLLSF